MSISLTTKQANVHHTGNARGGEEATTGLSPMVKARIAGFLYLIIIVGGIFAQIFVRDRLMVSGDPAATLRHIAEHEFLYRLGFAVEVFYLLCGIPLAFLLYDIFKVVKRNLAVVMVLFAAVGAANQGVILLAHYAPLLFLGKSAYLNAFTGPQLEVAAYLSMRIFDFGYMIALAFFGCFCLVIGYLVFRATFFPRIVGLLLAIEGTLYLTNSFAHFLAPPIGARVFPFLAAAGIAEVSFCLCLLLVGVNGQKWLEQAAQASVRIVAPSSAPAQG